ncbi:MAG: hypothetical protein Q8Q09_12680 [Deltaproteobacteria bacterium]|nr:hypothetical protein [Deltaproteobacteria bacterium]
MTFENLTNPWIFARIVIALAGVVLASIAARAALGAARMDARASSDEPSLSAERSFELASVALWLALGLESLSVFASIVVADRVSSSIRGAQCAFAIFDQGAWGPRALAIGTLAACAAAMWQGVARVDLQRAKSALRRPLALSALVCVALVWLDAAATSIAFLSVDLRAHASCCAASLVQQGLLRAGAEGGDGVSLTLAILGVWCIGVGLVARSRSARWATVGTVFSLIFVVLGVVFARDVSAPYLFEAPLRRCAYCLLRWRDAGLLGGAIVGLLTALALTAAHRLGTILAVFLLRESLSTESTIVRTRWRLLALLLVCGAAIVLPVIRYGAMTGTLRLWGG